MCEDSFDSIDMIPKPDMLELINYFELTPAHIASAITVINCMRNQSFLEIGPREYLNKLATTRQLYPKGHSTGNRLPSSSPILRNVLFSYQSLQMQLSVAKDLNFSSNDTIDKLLELMCFISPDGIDLRLLFDWIRPSYIPIYLDSKMKDSTENPILWKPTPIKMTASLLQSQAPNELLTLTSDLEISITIQSLLPRLVKTTGELAFLWKISRTISDLKQFCEFLSHLWRKEISFPLTQEGSQKKSTKIISDLNQLLQTISSDSLWLQHVDHISCKKFLGIHIGDACDIQIHDKMMFVISPLVATGVLKIQHHIGYSDHSQPSSSSSSSNNQRTNSPSGMLLGIHSSFQSAITHQLQITSKDDLVSQNVVRFLYGYFLAPTEENWIDLLINKDNLLPHVISAVMKTSTDFKICLELCQAAYDYSYHRGLYASAFTLSQRILDLLLTLHHEQHHEEMMLIAQWKYKVAFCCYRAENFLEANKLYHEALKLFQTLSTDVTRDVMIAKLFAEMSDINLSLNNFDTAALHLISMSKIWFTLSSSSSSLPLSSTSVDAQQQGQEQQEQQQEQQQAQPGQGQEQESNQYQQEIIEFYKKMTTIKMLSKNYHQAIEFCQLGLDLMVSVLGHDTQEVASFMVTHGEAHVKLNHFQEARIIFEEALEIYQKFNEDLVHPDVPSLLYSLSTCCNNSTNTPNAGDEDTSLKLTTEKYLYLCLDVIEQLLTRTSKVSKQFSSSSRPHTKNGGGTSAASATTRSPNTSTGTSSSTSKLLEIKAECYHDLSYLDSEHDHDHAAEEAIHHSQQAYEIIRQLHGANSHHTALALCHIGKIYKKLIKYSESKKIFYEVLLISEKCLRTDAAIEALNNLADIYFSQSKFIETEQYLNKALSRLREIQYSDDEDVESTEQCNSLIAQQLCTLADLKKETNEFEKSRQYYEGALLILKTTYGAQHNSVAQVLEMLSDLFMERGEERIGKRYRDEALAIYHARGGSPLSLEDQQQQHQESRDDTDETKKDIFIQGNSTSALGGLAALLSAEERYDDIIPLQDKVLSFSLLTSLLSLCLTSR
jgi:tetratricopeptide (TPR) repeat protein